MSVINCNECEKNNNASKKGDKSTLLFLLIIFAILVFIIPKNDDSNKQDKINDKKEINKTEIITSNNVSKENNEEKNISDKEILFMETPWGISYTEFNNLHNELGVWALSGEMYKTYSIDDIVLNDYEGIDFEYSDINIIGNCYNGEVDVAGYTTKSISLYFSYIAANEVLTKTENDSAFYGARYEFEPTNVNEMYSDLTKKLSSVYGEPYKNSSYVDMFKNKYNYTYWYGQNDTMLVLKSVNTENDTTDLYEDEIYISYVWLKGDELLLQASDTLKQEAINKEKEIYGNNSTNGL